VAAEACEVAPAAGTPILRGREGPRANAGHPRLEALRESPARDGVVGDVDTVASLRIEVVNGQADGLEAETLRGGRIEP
jgi:hypothetical protein